MFKDIKILGKESAIYGLSSVIARMLNFLLLPFYTHYLSTADYGIVAIVFSYIAFLNILYQYGMDQGYMRYSRENKNAFGASVTMIVFTGILFSSLLIFKSGFWAAFSGISPENSKLVSYAAAILFLDAASVIGFAELRMSHKAAYFSISKVAVIVVNITMNIIFIAKMGMKAEGVFLANIISSFSGLLLVIPVYLAKFKFEFDFKIAKKLAAFSLPLLPAGAGAMAVRVIDRPLLLHFMGASAVGIYQANYKLGIFMMLFITMFDQAWRPFFIERADNPDSPKLFARVLTYFFAAACWIFLAVSFFIGDIVKIKIAGAYIIHSSFWPGLNIVPLILAAYLFNGVYINFIAGIIISKKTKWIMAVSLSGAALNVILNLIMIPLWGGLGAAWAVLFSYAFMSFALYKIADKFYPVRYEHKRLLSLFILTGFLFAVYFIKTGIYSAMVFKAAALLAYPLILWAGNFFYLSEKEKILLIISGVRR